MARLRLTIGNISVSTEVETGRIALRRGLLGMDGYDVSLVDFSFKKKMYQPTELLADLRINMSLGSNTSWKAISRQNVEKLFKHKRVSLEVLRNDGDENDGELIDVVGDDYFVHEVRPCYNPDSMTVKLKIYSLDKLLTLSRYCKSWTAKKLSEHILKSELPNYKVPYNQNEHIACDASTMKHLLKDGQEHIFPYLVQYNESFYDMLIRTCNRWGEFVYWEDGKLHIGCDPESKQAKAVSGYHSITFQDFASEQPIKEGSTYVSEAPYENNVLNSKVVKDGAAIVFGTIENMTDMEAGGDFYWLRKVGQVLTNSKPMMNFIFDTAVNDLIAWGQQDSLVSQWNDAHNDAYFIKKKKPGISTLDEQYTQDKKVLNQWSEAAPIVGPTEYAKILAGEAAAEQNIIEIDYDTTWPGLKLGDIIKANDEEFVVVEIASRDTDKFVVKAIAKEGGVFYPTMIPAGHIRTSGPQVALVVDADDPLKKNRVRLQYPWQLTGVNPVYEEIMAKNLKGHDISDATPWLLYASASGPTKAGVHGRHYLAEKVLVNYANNNVERPFVVGAVSTDTPGSIKAASAVMQAPNGTYIKVHEGMGKGASAFMANFTPGLSLANGFVSFPDFFGSDNEMSKAFEGGVELGDKYGVWNISCSTDKRSIKINSPWGDVAINAFTGITINAPNGDVRIKGKNVSIEAGNNLSLKSGTNITNKFISTYGGGAAFNMTSFMYDAMSMATQKLASMVESVFDLSLIRSLIEVYWRPQEGALSIQSNRYLKMGAGGAMPGYPDAAYLHPKKRDERDEKLLEKQLPDTLKMGPAMATLVNKLPKIAETMVERYKARYRDCINKKKELEDAIGRLKNYSDIKGNDKTVCKDYNDLKQMLWDAATKKITEADMDFKANCASDSSDDVNLLAYYRCKSADVDGYNKCKNDMDKIFAYILKRRVECKKDVVDKANVLLESINRLRTDPQKLGDLHAAGISPEDRHAPAGAVKALLAAISAEKCKDTAFFKYACNEQGAITDDRANLTEECLNEINFHEKALMRRAALNLMEGWGMESKPVEFKLNGNKIEKSGLAEKPARPASDADFEDEGKWSVYVSSLQFTKPIAKTGSYLDEAVSTLFDPTNLKLATTFQEYYSWSNPKAGQILFGTGATYSMKADGTISRLETHCNQAKISSALLSEEDQAAFDQLNMDVQNTLKNLGSEHGNAPIVVVNPNPNPNPAGDDNENGGGNDDSFVLESLL